MRIGIVGSEAAKFTPETQEAARKEIRRLIQRATLVISGGCHLGGIDIWGVEEAGKAGIDVLEHLPARRAWEGGYKQRNLRIADSSDKVVCITVRELPPGYTGMRFTHCYHCGQGAPPHVKSGGCWTMKQARLAGKETELIII